VRDRMINNLFVQTKEKYHTW